MEEKELPKKGELIRYDLLKINRNKQKDCQCDRPTYELDMQNERVECSECGAVIPPFKALLNLARRHDRINEIHEARLEQAEAIKNYKPHLRTIKELEKKYRGNKLVPHCPACEEPFYLEDIKNWSGVTFMANRIGAWKQAKAEREREE